MVRTGSLIGEHQQSHRPEEEQEEGNDEEASASEFMYVRYAGEFLASERQAQASENGLLLRVNRAIIYYLGAYCCNLDLQAGRPEIEESSVWCEYEEYSAPCQLCPYDCPQSKPTRQILPARPLTKRPHLSLEQSKWKRQLRFGWIPQTLLACYFTFAAYLLLALYYQYSFDFDLLRLHKVRELRERLISDQVVATGLSPDIINEDQGHGHRLNSLAMTEASIEARIDVTKRVLNFLGPDHSHLNILVECFYLSILVLVTLIYLSFFLHYRFQRPFDYHIVRDLIDRKRERANIKRLVERQVAKFVESSRVYRENLINCDTVIGLQADLRFVFDETISASTLDELEVSQFSSKSSATFRREHELNQMVREMLASGSLTPLYQTRAWLKRRTNLQFVYHMALLLYAIVFDVCLTVGFFTQANPDRSASASHHSLIQVACLGLLTIAGPSVAVHAPIFMTVVLEQLNYVQQLRLMTKKCIQENSRAFAAIVAARSAQRQGQLHEGGEPVTLRVNCWTDHERIMNSNLIFLLLHYKIFVAQLLPIKRSIGFVNIVALFLLFTIPIITRIHEPYMSVLNDGIRLSSTQLKIFTILISSSILVPANLISGPVCFMFARCMDLYRDLCSLMAHISEVKSITLPGGTAESENIYDSHTENCLLKELSDSKQLLEQLTMRASGVSGTYKMLVKAHFWYGLIAISILVDSNYGTQNSGGGELLSSLFSDPLGVYSKIK